VGQRKKPARGSSVSRDQEPHVRVVTVDLRGGLGNQMLTVLSATAVSRKAKMKLRFRASRINGTLRDSIVGFGFPTFGTPATDAKSPAARGIRNSVRKLAALVHKSRAVERLIRKRGDIVVLHGSTHDSFDQAIHKLSRAKTIRGFFDDCCNDKFFPNELLHQFKIPESAASAFYKQSLHRAQSIGPHAIHLRRGDFKRIPGATLPISYYERGLEKVLPQRTGPVWVFSDSPMELDVASFLDELGVAWEWVSPPPDSSAAESLALLASCSTLICANSTFSWWAAHLSPQKKILVPAEASPNPFIECQHFERI